jgi:hypothetical protein
MSADQFAQVLEVYADLREHYVSPAARADGAFYAPETTDNDRHLMIEVSSLRNGAWALRNLKDVPVGIPSWLTDEYSNAVDAITHGDNPALGGTTAEKPGETP